MAPEIYRRDPYTHKCDVFSFAMICYHLFEGTPALGGMTPVDAAREMSTEGRRPTWANEVRPLQCMWGGGREGQAVTWANEVRTLQWGGGRRGRQCACEGGRERG